MPLQGVKRHTTTTTTTTTIPNSMPIIFFVTSFVHIFRITFCMNFSSHPKHLIFLDLISLLIAVEDTSQGPL
jgi:hypothetical protein